MSIVFVIETEEQLTDGVAWCEMFVRMDASSRLDDEALELIANRSTNGIRLLSTRLASQHAA